MNDEADVVRAWWQEQRFTMPAVLQPKGEVSRPYGVHTLTTNCVIGPDGKILHYAVGYDEAAILAAIESGLQSGS